MYNRCGIRISRRTLCGCSEVVEHQRTTVDAQTMTDSEPDTSVTVTVDGCLVSFNGVGTLWLNEPYSLAEVLADRVTQQVATMYLHGYVHRSRGSV